MIYLVLCVDSDPNSERNYDAFVRKHGTSVSLLWDKKKQADHRNVFWFAHGDEEAHDDWDNVCDWLMSVGWAEQDAISQVRKLEKRLYAKLREDKQ